MNDPFEKEVAVFGTARRLSETERAAYLEEACAGDTALRQRVEELLRASQETAGFLQKPALGAERPEGASALFTPALNNSAPGEKPGDRIGRYKLLQQIGEGGCGIVYMSEQEEPVRRRVALKVIKLGMDTRSVIARFEAERQALAMMDHPNIAKVLDAGATETGRPYFVMELVRGIKITEYSDEHHLSTNERLDLFLQVCHAVQHAHQKGIIHRDLKPSNILVARPGPDSSGVPRVIDFGIAKATQGRLTDQTLFTAFEQFIGTPAYMSPEQAELTMQDVDTRTDIYSLGVLLYELLTGRTPFDAQKLLASGLDEMRRTIREQEPERPSTRLTQELVAADVRRLKSSPGGKPPTEEEIRASSRRLLRLKEQIKLLRGDLDWIVMKCLEKDRTRRYETTNGLAMDIQRYLRDEPVAACPPSKLYRFQKLVRRNKTVCAAAGAVGLVLVLGVLGSTWQALRAGRAEQTQALLRVQADAQRQKAEAEADLLKKMLQGVGPSVAKGRDTKLLQDILDQTVSSLARDLTNQPEVEVDLSLVLAQTYGDLGVYKRAEEVARHSLEVARTRLGEENEHVARSLIVLALGLVHLAQQDLGEMYADVSETEKGRRLQNPTLREAEKCCVDGLAMHRKLLGNENVRVAFALTLMGEVRLTQYKFDEAAALKRQALAIYRKLQDNSMEAGLLRQLAILLAAREDALVEGENMMRDALVQQKKLFGGDHPDIARSLVFLGTFLRREGKWAQAEVSYRDGLAMWGRLQVKDNYEIASALNYLSEVLLHQGKLEDAEIPRREELAITRKLNGDEHANVVESLARLAFLLGRQGKMDEAEARAREALAMSQKLAATASGTFPATVDTVDTLLQILLPQHKELEAEQLLGDLLKTTAEGRPEWIGFLEVRGAFFARSRRWKDAVGDFRKAAELDPSDEDTAFGLAVLLLETGDRENYRIQCQKMMASFRSANAANPLSKTAEACLLLTGEKIDTEAAGQLADLAVKLGGESFRAPNLRFIKGLARYRAGQFDSAIDWLNKSIGQPTMVLGPRPDAAACMVLAMAQHQLKRSDEARAALTKGLDIVNAKLLKLDGPLDENWADWLTAHILFLEAKALIEGQPDTSGKVSK